MIPRVRKSISKTDIKRVFTNKGITQEEFLINTMTATYIIIYLSIISFANVFKYEVLHFRKFNIKKICINNFRTIFQIISKKLFIRVTHSTSRRIIPLQHEGNIILWFLILKV